MHLKRHLARMAVVGLLASLAASGCAASSPASSPVLEQPVMTSHMKSVVGTPDELSPLAPPEARKIRKVGNQWLCEINGQAMVFNDATARWEPQHK